MNAVIASIGIKDMDIHSSEELLRVAKDGIIIGDVIIRQGVDTIEGIRIIQGTLGITYRSIISLGSLKEVTGELWVSIYEEPCQLESLGNLKRVGGDVNVKACLKLESLGDLEYVGGSLNIRNTLIRNLGKVTTIQGNLHVPVEMKDTISFDDITIGGKVSYWKFRVQYGEQAKFVNVLDLRAQELQLGRDVITGELSTRIGHISEFTSFGRANIESIYPFIEAEIHAFVAEHHATSYLDVFFDGRHPYRKDLAGFFNSEYYRPFFQDDASFEYYDGMWSQQHYKCEDGYTCLVFQHAIAEQITKFFRVAEDKFRESVGIPKIGEGWVSETELYYKIKDEFPDHGVVQHARPKWLGLQHLDIYFPDDNVAIEYQGLQHYQPVEIFGGEEGFHRTRERDGIKLQKCQANGCILLYVNESMTFEEVVHCVKIALSDKNSPA